MLRTNDPNQTTLNLPFMEGEASSAGADTTTLKFPWEFTPAGSDDPNQETLSDPFGLFALFGGKPDTSPVYRPDYARTAAAAAARGYAYSPAAEWFTKNQNLILIASAVFVGLAITRKNR